MHLIMAHAGTRDQGASRTVPARASFPGQTTAGFPCLAGKRGSRSVSRPCASVLTCDIPSRDYARLWTTRCAIVRPVGSALDELEPGRAAVAYRPAQRHIASGTAEGEVPLRE